MNEKRLTDYNESDKAGFINLIIKGALTFATIATTIPLMIMMNSGPVYAIGSVLGALSIGLTAEHLKDNFEGIRNHIFGKRYEKRYYDDMFSKIARVQGYINTARTLSDSYIIAKTENLMSNKALEELRYQAFEKTLQAKTMINIHNANLLGNQNYFNKKVLKDKNLNFFIYTSHNSFDLTEKEVEPLIHKYRAIEDKFKNNCNVANFDIVKEAGNMEQSQTAKELAQELPGNHERHKTRVAIKGNHDGRERE